MDNPDTLATLGTQDTTFSIQSCRSCYARLSNFYKNLVKWALTEIESSGVRRNTATDLLSALRAIKVY